MKSQIFDQYLEAVCKRFDIADDEFFSDSQEMRIVDARGMLFLLCIDRPMNVKYIQDYMARGGKRMAHSTILHGANKMRERMKKDRDIRTIVKHIRKCVD